ncbi:MAG: flagellar hook-basal body complex protein [Dermatophilus congolensis]|nr:flagellar hook-basal body complex protein [Dermatophilus congolensis]
MIRSMWSAVSGLRNHQIYLDVTGNNIANVNTHGYKSTRAVFEDSLSQVVRNASAPNGINGVGGMNPTQIGLGVKLGQILGNFTQGGLQVTNVATDIAIQGDGFFIIDKGGEKFYTRNGAFSLDKNGDLVTSDGSYVQGFMNTNRAADPYDPAAIAMASLPVDPAGAPVAMDQDGDTGEITTESGKINISVDQWQSFQIAPDGTISGVAVGDTSGTLRTIGQIALAKFNNPPGLDRVGGTMFAVTLNSGNPFVSNPANRDANMGLVTSGTLELSNVDLAGEFTNLIMAQRGFQSNSKVVTASDEVLQDLINMKR